MVSSMAIYDFIEYNYRLHNGKTFMHIIIILLEKMQFRYAQQCSARYLSEYLPTTFKIRDHFKLRQKLFY